MPLTEDDLKALKAMMAELLETYGLKKPPSAAALRQRRYRERHAPSQSVTKRHKSVTRTEGKRNGTVTKRNEASPERNAPSRETWSAYSAAYLQRYGVEPTRNATVNGQLAQFVGRVPQEEAPEIAAFFVRHNKSFYISSRHAVGALLKDAEGLRTEWLSGRTVTDTEAKQADRTQANANVFGKLITEARNAGK
jgi:hypothetical protein